MKHVGNSLPGLKIGIKGAGEMASGIAWRLYTSNIEKIFMMEVQKPLLVRRLVSFGEAVNSGETRVEGVNAIKANNRDEIEEAWRANNIAVAVDPDWKLLGELKPHILIDAIMAKKNLGTRINDAPLVIGIGPGFDAGLNVHAVIESNRGHNLGRVINSGSAQANTGIPGNVNGFTSERVARAPEGGSFQTEIGIGDEVNKGDIIGFIDEHHVTAGIDGIIRGLITPGTKVRKNEKIGDIDPRGNIDYCTTISEKARAIGGGVLEAILSKYNR